MSNKFNIELMGFLSLPAVCYQGIFPRHALVSDDGLASRSQAPATRTKRFVQNPSVFNLWEVDNPIRLDFDIIGRYRLS